MEKEKLLILDAETFTALEQEILPQIISQARLDHQGIRLWVVECPTGTVAISLALLLARLLGSAFAQVRTQIFVTSLDEQVLANARRGVFAIDDLPPQFGPDIARYCEPAGNGYNLTPLLRKMVIVGRHDLWHDPTFARLDMVLCGFPLLAHSEEHQRQFLSQVSASLTQSGYLVCPRQDSTVLAHFPYTPIREGLPIYQPVRTTKQAATPLFVESVLARRHESAVETISRLLHVLPAEASSGEASAQVLPIASHSQLRGEGPAQPALVPTQERHADDALLRFAPLGIVVIDHRYQILSCNRAAEKLLTLQVREGTSYDFFHAISGLPYQVMRTAIDTVMREGTSEILEEIELAVAAGGNGRVLSCEMYSIPTEVGAPPRVVLYFLDVTMQIVHKKIQDQQMQTIQDLSMKHVQLQKRCSDLERDYRRLSEVSQQLLIDYQGLATQLKETREIYDALDHEMEELRIENSILSEQQEHGGGR